MWFTEDPWSPIVGCLIIAAICFAAWYSTQRGALVLLLITALVACPVIFFVEGAIVTEGEKLEATIDELALAVADGNLETVVQHISPQAPEIQAMAATGLTLFEVQGDLSITDEAVDVMSQGSRAVTHFRANGTFALKGSGGGRHYPTRWELSWQKEAGEWRIIKVRRLDPITGEEVVVLEGVGRAAAQSALDMLFPNRGDGDQSDPRDQ